MPLYASFPANFPSRSLARCASNESVSVITLRISYQAHIERTIRGPCGTALFISERNKDVPWYALLHPGYAPLRITINKINVTMQMICNKDMFVNAGLATPIASV